VCPSHSAPKTPKPQNPKTPNLIIENFFDVMSKIETVKHKVEAKLKKAVNA